MQISEKMGQYNRNVTNGTDELRGAQGVQKMVSSVRDMEAGSIFEGTVNTVKNGKVVLALANGQVLSARLDGRIGITPGASMFFQVKSNDGTTISIRPYMGAGNTGNPILLNALTAAGVPVTERNLMMVDAMMREQMPIGKSGVLDMAKILNSHPDANVETLVQMTKLGIPVTEEMAAQFENYLTDRHELLSQMEQFTEQLAEVLGDAKLPQEESFAIYSRILKIFSSAADLGSGKASETMKLLNAEGAVSEGTFRAGIGADLDLRETAPGTEIRTETEGAGLKGEMNAAGTGPANLTVQGETAGAALTELLSEEQQRHLTKLILGVPTLAGNEALFPGAAQEEIFVDTLPDELLQKTAAQEAAVLAAPEKAVLDKELTAGQFLNAVREALEENSQYGFAGIQKLFRGKEFRLLLKNMIEEQWTIKPQELKSGGRISGLYERMESQMNQVESAMRMAGLGQSPLTQAAAEIRSNIEFMNQVNQLYTYVQIPLKMTGQKANGELYVYTNQKQLQDPDAELTAFLHLELSHLGATDVSVKLRNKNVTTNFYLSDDVSYDLLEKHLPILEKKLKKKGYSCKITVSNEDKKMNLAENFLQKDLPPAGTLHRYSFDVRA